MIVRKSLAFEAFAELGAAELICLGDEALVLPALAALVNSDTAIKQQALTARITRVRMRITRSNLRRAGVALQ